MSAPVGMEGTAPTIVSKHETMLKDNARKVEACTASHLSIDFHRRTKPPLDSSIASQSTDSGSAGIRDPATSRNRISRPRSGNILIMVILGGKTPAGFQIELEGTGRRHADSDCSSADQ